jgi:hypothetical protein
MDRRSSEPDASLRGSISSTHPRRMAGSDPSPLTGQTTCKCAVACRLAGHNDDGAAPRARMAVDLVELSPHWT